MATLEISFNDERLNSILYSITDTMSQTIWAVEDHHAIIYFILLVMFVIFIFVDVRDMSVIDKTRRLGSVEATSKAEVCVNDFAAKTK